MQFLAEVIPQCAFWSTILQQLLLWVKILSDDAELYWHLHEIWNLVFEGYSSFLKVKKVVDSRPSHRSTRFLFHSPRKPRVIPLLLMSWCHSIFCTKDDAALLHLATRSIVHGRIKPINEMSNLQQNNNTEFVGSKFLQLIQVAHPSLIPGGIPLNGELRLIRLEFPQHKKPH